MVLIYSRKFSSRHRYVFDWIFDQWGIKYSYTSNKTEFELSSLPGIWYSNESPPDKETIIIHESGLLSENGIVFHQPHVTFQNNIPYLYFGDEIKQGFDFFSAIFFMLSRYEEYLPFESDHHSRFPAAQSLAFRYSFLELPVVDIWVREFYRQLASKYSDLVPLKGKFHAIMTYDIDVAYKFRGRSFIHQILAGSRDLIQLKWGTLISRFTVLLRVNKDPWDVFKYLEDKIRDSLTPAIFFFPCGKRTSFDKNQNPKNPLIERLIIKSKSFVKIGLHPSYQSVDRLDLLTDEKRILEQIVMDNVVDSRQHFLRFKMPETFLALSKAGIRFEYSMLFPDAPGFRAGTCRPFYFFDLYAEQITSLRLYPGCWMDSTFINYSQSGSHTALVKAKELIQVIRKVGGYFIPIFHNNTLEYENWRGIHEEIWNEINNEIRHEQ